MNSQDLMQLGLNRNESIVYLALVRFREADAHSIIQETKFHKKIVYDNLQRLMDKGLVASVIKERRRVFSLTNTDMLSAYVEEQEKTILQKKDLAIRIKKEIESSSRSYKEKQDAKLYSGMQAARSFYAETLQGGDYYVLGAPQESLDIMGELFWDSHHLKRKKNKQKAYLLLNSSLKKWGKQQKDNYTEIRYFDADFEPKTEIHIQQDIVAIIVWTQEPVIFKMKSETLSKSYKKYFERMWKLAKK